MAGAWHKGTWESAFLKKWPPHFFGQCLYLKGTSVDTSKVLRYDAYYPHPTPRLGF